MAAIPALYAFVTGLACRALGLGATAILFSGTEDESMGGRRQLDLTACERLSGGVVWLRYRITPVDPLDHP